MRSVGNCLLHGLYLPLYSLVKYSSFPFSGLLRYGVLRLFSSGIRTTHIGDGVTIWFPWRVAIGSRSSVNQGVIIDGFGRVEIGQGVRIAPYVCINTADHEFDDPDMPIMHQGYVVAGVSIGDDVWIGSGAQINKGVRIGEGSVIGSGSVVTKDIPPYAVAVGVPSRVIGSRR
ncbi:acyltransferase [Candidatus Latescibacterota bacterium]